MLTFGSKEAMEGGRLPRRPEVTRLVVMGQGAYGHHDGCVAVSFFTDGKLASRSGVAKLGRVSGALSRTIRV